MKNRICFSESEYLLVENKVPPFVQDAGCIVNDPWAKVVFSHFPGS